MPNYVIFEPTSSPVPNRVIGKAASFPAEKQGQLGPNKVEVDSLDGITQWHKVSNGQVVPMTQAEIDSIVAASQAADKAAIKAAAKAIFVTPEDPTAHAVKLAFETLIELMVNQINTLRTSAGLATITNNQVKTSFKSTYESKVDAL
jgi:hypothetical protein